MVAGLEHLDNNIEPLRNGTRFNLHNQAQRHRLEAYYRDLLDRLEDIQEVSTQVYSLRTKLLALIARWSSSHCDVSPYPHRLWLEVSDIEWLRPSAAWGLLYMHPDDSHRASVIYLSMYPSQQHFTWPELLTMLDITS